MPHRIASHFALKDTRSRRSGCSFAMKLKLRNLGLSSTKWSVSPSALSNCSSIHCMSLRRSFSTTLRRNATWGFIGLGQMGYPMAKNLRAKIPPADTLIICDVNKDVLHKFVEDAASFPAADCMDTLKRKLNIEITTKVREAAERSDTVITSLPEPQHVKDVFRLILEPGVLPIVPQGRLFIDCSTIDPTSSKEVADTVHLAKAGHFVDAPMSGGVVGARTGTLSFMFGASTTSDGLVERVKSVLLLMGKRVWHLGEQGSGVSGKLANNYILAINNIATAEAMNLGIRWGLNPRVLADMINASTGRCWPSEVNNPIPGLVETAPASRGYEGGFGVSLMKKDLKLAISAARESGASLELAETARKVYEATEDNYRGKDFSVVYKYLQDKSR